MYKLKVIILLLRYFGFVENGKNVKEFSLVRLFLENFLGLYCMWFGFYMVGLWWRY